MQKFKIAVLAIALVAFVVLRLSVSDSWHGGFGVPLPPSSHQDEIVRVTRVVMGDAQRGERKHEEEEQPAVTKKTHRATSTAGTLASSSVISRGSTPREETVGAEAKKEKGGLYHNPYDPLFTTSQPCHEGLHRSGQWVKNETLLPRYPSYGEILGCCQRGYDAKHGKGAVRPETQYQWNTDKCELVPWSEEMFCKALRGRDIMFAGDSLNDHWHASLYYLLGGRKDIYRREGTVAGKHSCRNHSVCSKYYPKPLKIYFLTNQLLMASSRRNRNHKWWKPINKYSILVLNAGSWMRDPADEEREVSDQEYERHMKKALALVKEMGYNGTIIWRTTYQGHPYCWTYTEPLTKELNAEDFPTVAPYKRYRWAAIPGRNAFATDLWRNAGAHILDVTRITNLMPLGHLGQNHPKFAVRNVTDCLHYCSPGPIYDTWSMLLMNLLLGNLS